MITSQTPHTLPAQLVRFEDRFAVLHFETPPPAGGQELRWPIKNFPDEINVGDMLSCSIFSSKETPSLTPQRPSAAVENEEEKYARMRRLLEELIN